MKSFRAFTLIELLIVVAIIAILAAIAVPNFLEAQTRSKVSRAKADMRSLATAVEAYAVDENTYPLDGDDIDLMNILLYDVTARMSVLTTPVAYITSLPQDPFHLRLTTNPSLQVLFPGQPPYTYSYLTWGNILGFPTGPGPTPPKNDGKPDNYGIISLGPNEDFDSQSPPDLPDNNYDPTNGTTSRGDIIRLGGERFSAP